MNEPLTGACLAVGSELLGEDRLDSNSLTVTAVLARYGIPVVEKRVVGDSIDGIAAAIRELLARVDVLVITGGLGPTADDVTREAVAAALDRPLEHSAEVEGWVRDRYREHGRDMLELCRRMAQVVRGARPLPNAKGAAPGLLLSIRGRLVAALPGVPWEMEQMLADEVEPELALLSPGARRCSRTLLLSGVFESVVEEQVRHLYERFGRESVSVLASTGVVRIVMTAVGERTAAERRLTEMEAAFRGVLGDDVAGADVASLEQAVLEELIEEGFTLAVAESCTGGLLASRLTDVPGASAGFLGGVVTYSNEAKEALVGVPRSVLIDHGAVSEPVARAMAEGVRARFESTWGAAITGIAGPSGGTSDKPVGLVHWAVSGPARTVADHRVLPGDRTGVRRWSVHLVLDMVRREAERMEP